MNIAQTQIGFVSAENSTSCFNMDSKKLFEVYPPLTELQKDAIGQALDRMYHDGFIDGVRQHQKNLREALGIK